MQQSVRAHSHCHKQAASRLGPSLRIQGSQAQGPRSRVQVSAFQESELRIHHSGWGSLAHLKAHTLVSRSSPLGDVS